MTTTRHSPVFRNVLCAVDFSAHSQAALYLAAGLTFAPGSQLTVLLVDDRASGDRDEVFGARRELDEFVRGVLPGPAGYRDAVQLEVRAGAVVATILATAVEVGAELIVAGSHGRGALGRALFGSTTAALLRDTALPIAIVPPSHPEIISLGESRAVPHVGTVLVPIDFNDATHRQLSFATRLARSSPDPSILMHVVPRAECIASAEARVKAIGAKTAAPRGWRIVTVHGQVAEEVLDVLRSEPVGAVVLGKSGAHPGKVAADVVRLGNAVVIMVP